MLEVSAWALRLTLLALLGSAAYLWFRPGNLPVEVTDTLNSFPRLRALLPEPGAQHFGISAAAPVVAVLLPLLAVLDVSRKLAGCRCAAHVPSRQLPVAEEQLPSTAAPQRATRSAPRRVDRREAAEAMAEAASPKPSRVTDRREQ